MKITRKNPFDGKETTLDLPVTEAQVVAWKNGMVAQRAFPTLTADQREFIISGIPPGKFEHLMSPTVPDNGWSEDVDGDLVNEASTLQIPPGQMPDTLVLRGALYRLMEEMRENEEVKGWRFRLADELQQPAGSKLNVVIFND